MRTWLIIATAVVAAACSESGAPAPDDEAGAASEPIHSVYEVAMADGSERIQTLYSDGRYSDAGPDGGIVEAGVWREQDLSFCFDPDGDAPETCYPADSQAADGSFDKITPDGTVYARLRRIE